MSYLYDLGNTPQISALLPTGETVTVEIYPRNSGTPVSLVSNMAVEVPTSSGHFVYTFDFTTKPAFGKNPYSIKFTSSTGTIVWDEVDWNDERAKYDGAAVRIDTSSGFAGAYYPNGTPYQPVNNLADAITIATNYNFKKFIIRSNLTLSQPLPTYILQGYALAEVTTIDLNGQDVTDTTFINLTLTGTQGPGSFIAQSCWLTSITDVNMHGGDIAIGGSFTIAAGGTWLLNTCRAQSALPVNVDMSGASILGFDGYNGQLVISNLGTPLGSIAVTGQHITTLMPSITAGVVFLGGIGLATNLGTPTSYTTLMLPSAVYEESTAAHINAGTFGLLFNQESIDVTNIAGNYLHFDDPRLDYLDASISSRLSSTGYTAPDNTTISEIKTDTGNLLSNLSATNGTVDSIKTETDEIIGDVNNIFDIVTSTGLIVKDLDANISVDAITNAVWDEPAVDHVIPDTMGKLQNTYRIARFVR